MIAATQQYQAGSDSHSHLKEVIELLQISSGYLANDAVLYKEGIKSSMSDFAERLLNDPLLALDKQMNDMLSSFYQLIHEGIVLPALSTKSHLISKAFRTYPQGLHYTIVLKNNTFENRLDMMDVLAEYEKQSISEKYPVVLAFVQEEWLPKQLQAQQIEF